jgi:acetate kinase
LGLSGLTSDMRELLEEAKDKGDRRAQLAIDIFCRRVRQYVGGYYAEMGGADAIAFTGGIGENSAEVRAHICDGLQCLGLEIDSKQNMTMVGGRSGPISTRASKLQAYVIPTNEELLIARDTYRVVTGNIEGGPGDFRFRAKVAGKDQKPSELSRRQKTTKI